MDQKTIWWNVVFWGLSNKDNSINFFSLLKTFFEALVAKLIISSLSET